MKRVDPIIFMILCLLSLLAAGCGQKGETAQEAAPPEAAEKGVILLSEEQLKVAGIVTEEVRMEEMEKQISITGELESVPDRDARVTSRLSGKVLQIFVQEGDRVSRGTPLASLESVEMAQADAAFHEAKAELDMADKNLSRVRDMARMGIYSKSSLEEAKNGCAEAKAGLEGARANLVMAQKQYDRTRELQSAGIAATKDLEKAEADLRKARADEQAAMVSRDSAMSRLKREEENYRKGHLTYKEVIEAEKVQQQAYTRYRSALSTLEIMGVSEKDHGRTFTVTSPIEGRIAALQITRGEAVVPTTPLMNVVDTELLWLMADIYEKDLSTIRTGQKATFSVSAFPGKVFRGTVSYISPIMNEKTRTVKARIQVANREGRLKVHMFARGTINADLRRKTILIPAEALQKEGEKDIVYIQKGRPGTFMPVEVKAGERSGERREILEGLAPGNMVVVKGSFMVRSEEQKSSLEGDE